MVGLKYIKQHSKNSKVYALDILDMEPLEGVNFYKISIEQIDEVESIFELKGVFDLVISDIAPNLSGIGAIDNENIYELESTCPRNSNINILIKIMDLL